MVEPEGLETSAENTCDSEKNEASAIVVGSEHPTVSAVSEPPKPEPIDSSEDARWSKVDALATAVRALLGAGLIDAARPLVDELVGLAESARGQRAEVMSLAERRGRET